VLTYPTTVAPGDEFSAVLRNPLSGPNVSCFLVVRLERWDGDSWGQPRELLPEGVDPNLAGPGADCAPDLIQPGAFIGERKFVVPDDLPPGNYRIVERSTEGEGRISVVASGTNVAVEPKPTGRYSIDLAPGGGLAEAPSARHFSLADAVVLDGDRLAIQWDSSCNSPGLRVAFDYHDDWVAARLDVGSFPVIDCVGEPESWSTVVDLPSPLWGRDVDVVLGDDTAAARRVEVTPLSTFVLPLIEPGNTVPAVSASIFRQSITPDTIRVQMYGGACIGVAQTAAYADDDGTLYVQPRVVVPNNASCTSSPWQTFVLPVQPPPGSRLFGPTSFW
jgi:hypothetical protein